MPVIEYFKFDRMATILYEARATGKAKSCDSNNFTSEMESPIREISVALE